MSCEIAENLRTSETLKERVRRKWRGTSPEFRTPTCPLDAETVPEWYDPARIRRCLLRDDACMWTYFMGWKGGPIKIGKALNPEVRLTQHQTSCPYRLYLWAVTTHPIYDELRLHTRFRDYRLMGEWFEPNPDLEAMMAGINGASKKYLDSIRNGTRFAEGAAENLPVLEASLVKSL